MTAKKSKTRNVEIPGRTKYKSVREALNDIKKIMGNIHVSVHDKIVKGSK